MDGCGFPVRFRVSSGFMYQQVATKEGRLDLTVVVSCHHDKAGAFLTMELQVVV